MNKNSITTKEHFNYGLLIIDAQEKILRPIENNEIIIKNIRKLINAIQILEESIFISEQNSMKLGKTIPSLVPSNEFKLFTKMEFSIGRNHQLLSDLSKKKIKNLIICGFETHICVQQSVSDFISNDIKTFIIADAMGSRNAIDHEIALKRMISEGAKIASTESIIFELCRTSTKKEFKQISNIIKSK